MSIYKSIPTKLKSDLKARQEQLFWKINSLEGHLYSLGAAVTECRKEYNDLRKRVLEASHD